MAGGLSILTQDQWQAGMFQGPDPSHIPANGAYDIVNGLVDVDEGVIYRRGGSTIKSGSATTNNISALWCGTTYGGVRTLFGDTAGNVWTLAANDSTLVALPVSSAALSGRGVVMGGLVLMPATDGSYYIWGGSRLNVSVYTHMATRTNASRTVTGTAGSAFLANAEAGTFMSPGGDPFPVVASVSSDTVLTLRDPYGLTTVTSGTNLFTAANNTPTVDGQTVLAEYLEVASNRVVFSNGSRVYFSGIGMQETFGATDFHELPSTVIGLGALQGNLLIFTTDGVWRLSNIAFDLTDAAGNIQQRLDRLSGEVVLWSHNGIASFENALVIPGTADVYLMDGASSPVSIGGPIQKLYRSYVDAGYTTGVGVTFRQHYFLPILNGSTWVDTLVCNLPARAWTRWAGHGGTSIGFARRAGASTRQPLLLSANAKRVLDVSAAFAPSAANKNDGDGTTHAFTVTTRDYTLGSLKAFVKKARLWVEGIDAASDDPTVTLSYAQGPAGSSFTSLGSTSAESTGDAPLTPWRVGAAGKRVRFKISSTSPFASLKLKALDLFVRPRSRQ